ncbi:MAG: hypothetical protein ABFC94_15685 [Syntrophomonas sp.]
MNESLVLGCNPFQDDYGDDYNTLLNDKIIKARKQHKCHMCEGSIKTGDIARSMNIVVDEKI